MKYKEFELIGSSFKRDKNCPYCTAKITKWPVVKNNFHLLEENRFEWKYKGVPITFYAKKLDYGFSNIVFYGGELVDYHLNKIKLKK